MTINKKGSVFILQKFKNSLKMNFHDLENII